MQYPNLTEIIRYHPYDIGTFAYFANVTTNLMKSICYEDEAMDFSELQEISYYAQLDIKVISLPKLILLDRNRLRHKNMMKNLNNMFYEIWEASKKK